LINFYARNNNKIKICNAVNFLIYLVFAYAYDLDFRKIDNIHQYFETFNMLSSFANVEKSIFRHIA